MKNPQAEISEIFSSIQGEGLHVGRRQVFVRFCGCNLKCRYCDTPQQSSSCRVETPPGSGEFIQRVNPLNVADLCEIIDAMAAAAPHHSISFTGGEPLLHTEFIAALPAKLGVDLPVHLETNGTLPAKLEEVIDCIDVVAMDIKLASAAGVERQDDASRAFLQIARRKQVFVKLVFDAAATADELDSIARLICDVDPALPVVLQPVTGGSPLTARQIIETHARLARRLSDVRVIPQTHKMLGCL